MSSHNFGEELNALSARYYEGEGCQKPLVYLAEYDRLFREMRGEPIRMLELGVRFGASMFVWADYFPKATIIGLDIDNKPQRFPDDPRVHFVQGSQADPTTLDRCLEVAGGQFDIIIDDASHIGHLTAAAFRHLFPGALRAGGFYVIEDICTSFLTEFPDGAVFSPAALGQQDLGSNLESHQNGMVGMVKRIINRAKTPVATQEPGPSTPASNFESHQNGMVGVVKQIIDYVMTPVATGKPGPYTIERITILPNIAVVKKSG
jgi:hypothetical protein